MSGIRAEITIGDPDACPVAAATAGTPGTAKSVKWTETGADEVVEEFALEGATADGDFEAVFDYGRERVYRFRRPADNDCVCGVVEGLDTPVADVRAEAGTLSLTLHLETADRLRDIIGDLRERFDDVAVRSLTRTDDEELESSDLVAVDRERLTDRQREVLETAYEMGYFNYPRDTNATEVAEALGIRPSTFTEHLAAAQGKLLDEVVDRTGSAQT